MDFMSQIDPLILKLCYNREKVRTSRRHMVRESNNWPHPRYDQRELVHFTQVVGMGTVKEITSRSDSGSQQ